MRRRTILLAAAAALLLIAVFVFYSGAASAYVSVSWSYDYTRQPACGDSRTKNCIDHFEILDYTDAQDPKVLRRVPNPADISGKVDNISDKFSYGPPFGLRTIVVEAVARDENGTPVTSNPFAARKDVIIRPTTSHAKQ